MNFSTEYICLSSAPDVMARTYWDAADTHRLNEAHWNTTLDDQPINDRIQADLATTRSRCITEAENNPLVDGVIFTHQTDIVGRDGPELQVQSSSEAYNEWLERHWRRWFRAPTPNPRVSGATMLRLWVRALWEKGEYLAQKVTKQHADTPVKLRIQPIDPRRLGTPIDKTGNDWVFEGVEIRPDGEPLRYYIEKVDSAAASLTREYEPVPAEDVIHFFVLRQEDQLRGKPWLSSCLTTSASLRGYDNSVAEAARQAAKQGVYWYTIHHDAPFMLVDDSKELEDGEQSTGPPGWQPAMLTPQQPSTNYKEYREERQAEIGRPVSMPLMIVRLDAGRHNYSSARFDGQNYDRGCEVIQYGISGSDKSVGPLSELVDDVAQEAYLAEMVAYRNGAGEKPPARPDDVVYDWTWPRPPHVDPQKEAEADRAELEMGAASYGDVLARRSQTVDGMIAKRTRDAAKLKAANLPPMPTVLTKGATYAQHDLADGSTPEPEPIVAPGAGAAGATGSQPKKEKASAAAK